MGKNTKQISIRVSDEEEARLKSLCNDNPLISVSTFAYACFQKGLPLIEAEYLKSSKTQNKHEHKQQRSAA